MVKYIKRDHKGQGMPRYGKPTKVRANDVVRYGQKFRGVFKATTQSGKYFAKFNKDGKTEYHGPYTTPSRAAHCYDELAKKYHSRPRLNYPKEQRKKFSSLEKDTILDRQQYCCNMCHKMLSTVKVFDHMVPLFLGGADELYNLQVLCGECNRFKTEYLDNRVLGPVKKRLREQREMTLTAEMVLKIQKREYQNFKDSLPVHTVQKSVRVQIGKLILTVAQTDPDGELPNISVG